MKNSKNNDEIDLKHIALSFLRVVLRKKKSFFTILIGILLLAFTYFFYIMFQPTYKASYLIRSKYVEYDQISNTIEKYNYYISEPKLNPLEKAIEESIISLGLKKILVSEVKERENIIKKDEIKFRNYNLIFLFKNRISFELFSDKNQLILKDIQSFCSTDNEIIENRKKLKNNIDELDSLIQVAYKAGIGYTNNISTGTNGQLMVMNDLYSGINELISQKILNEQNLALNESNNILFRSSPIIIAKQIEYPAVIFAAAFVLWIFICIFLVIVELIFSSDTNND